MVNWFELIDNRNGKRYRILYEKPITQEKRKRWRKEWKEGKISFVCGCGCPFGINAKGAMYYPAVAINGNGERRHQKQCIKYRQEAVRKGEAALIVNDIPRYAKEAGLYRNEWKDIYRLSSKQLKTSHDKELNQMLSIRVLEDGVERRLKQYIHDVKTVDENVRFFVVARIKELKEYPYGFSKLTLLMSNQSHCAVWLSNQFLSGCEKTIESNDVFIGFCFVRNENWKGTMYRKIYVLEGLIA